MAASAQPMRWVVCSTATTRFSLMSSPRTRNASSAVLRRVVGDGVADGRRDGLAGRLARHGRIGRRNDGAGLDLREIDHRDFGRQDARDLDQVDVADAGCEKRVVEGVEGGAALGVTGSRCSHRHLPRHSLLLN